MLRPVLRLTQEIAATQPTAEPSEADVRLAGEILSQDKGAFVLDANADAIVLSNRQAAHCAAGMPHLKRTEHTETLVTLGNDLVPAKLHGMQQQPAEATRLPG